MLSILSKDDVSVINDMIHNFKNNSELELEVGFKYIDYSNYVRIAGGLVNITDEKNIESIDSLDAIILLTDGNSYRISFKTSELIDEFIAISTSTKEKKSMSDIQRYLLSLKPSDNIEIIFKNKKDSQMLQVSDLNIVFKLTSEIPWSEKN